MPRVNISEVTDDSGVKIPVLILDYELVGDNSTGIGIVGSLKTSDNTLGEYSILDWDTRGSNTPTVEVTGGSSIMQSNTVTLTAADLADLHNTPFELVPAPGSDKAIMANMFEVVARRNGFNLTNLTYPTPPTAVTFVSSDSAMSVQPTYADFFSLFQGIKGLGPSATFVAHQFSCAEDKRTNVSDPWSPELNHPLANDSTPNSTVNRNLVISAWGVDTWSYGGEATPLFVTGAITDWNLSGTSIDWAASDTFKLGDAEFVVDSVDGLGQVLTCTMTAPGTTNIIATGVAVTDASGAGTDLTLDVTAIDYSVNTMTLTIKTLYTVLDV